jgi:prephenate dehydratase
MNMEDTIIEQTTRKVSIQGIEGCFHHVAAMLYFGNELEVRSSPTFEQSLKNVREGRTTYALMAIENSIAGSILPNYELLRKSGLKITGEISIHIAQHLMALPGQHIDSIYELRSHPMAIHQCKDFLAGYPHIKLVESPDTALSAKEIAEENISGVAAIASDIAARQYGLEILMKGIESHKHNYTRFLVLASDPVTPVGAAKASVYFQTSHVAGSLAATLNVIASYGINLSKIQSHPVPSRNMLYGFYADMEIADIGQLPEIMEALKAHTTRLELLGTYRKGDRYD